MRGEAASPGAEVTHLGADLIATARSVSRACRRVPTASSSRIRSTSPQVAASSRARSRARATTPTAGNGTAHIGRWLKIVGSSSRPNPASSSSPGDLAPVFGSSASTVPRDRTGRISSATAGTPNDRCSPSGSTRWRRAYSPTPPPRVRVEDAVEQRPEGDRVVAVRGSRFPVGLLLLECALQFPVGDLGRREGSVDRREAGTVCQHRAASNRSGGGPVEGRPVLPQRLVEVELTSPGRDVRGDGGHGLGDREHKLPRVGSVGGARVEIHDGFTVVVDADCSASVGVVGDGAGEDGGERLERRRTPPVHSEPSRRGGPVDRRHRVLLRAYL